MPDLTDSDHQLGMFGFLSGPTFVSEGDTANLGLLDQRFALEWVEQHISKFGGDPGRITVTNINITSIESISDPTAKEHCYWW